MASGTRSTTVYTPSPLRLRKSFTEAATVAVEPAIGLINSMPRSQSNATVTPSSANSAVLNVNPSSVNIFATATCRSAATAKLYHALWEKARGERIEGISLEDARAITQAVRIPVICTGGFQTASVIREAISGGSCDAVSIARPLIANNDLVQMFAQGLDRAPKPCTYCNKCLVNVLENPLGCYEETRYGSHDEMIQQIMSVYDPPPFAASSGTSA